MQVIITERPDSYAGYFDVSFLAQGREKAYLDLSQRSCHLMKDGTVISNHRPLDPGNIVDSAMLSAIAKFLKEK